MFHPKYQPLLFAFFMALFMSFWMSAVISFINVGWIENFVYIWLHAWWIAFVVAFPSVIFVAPMVRKVVGKLVQSPS